MSKITAAFIKEIQSKGIQKLYKLSEPVKDGDGNDTEHVIVSAVSAAFDTGQPETYIFPSDKDGNVTDWGEMEGSYRGGTDHDKAITDAGWSLI